ncbi:MAG: DUF4230 domain-containing protein [Edaphobacter sp.]
MLTRIQPTMTTQYNSGRGSSGSFLAFILALVLGAAAMVAFLRHANTGILARVATAITGRATTDFDTSVPTIVQKIQRLNRLETVVYSLDTVIEGSKSSAVLPDLLAGDRILLIVHGQSIAGVDLSKLRSEDVRINGRSIRVTLPASELFITSIDNQRTRVYARSTGLLTSPDQNLESETRARAKAQLQKDALSNGILDAARKNARDTVTTLLYGLGFQHVEVM